MKKKERIDTDVRLSELERLLADFKAKFEAGTSDSENFIRMSEIERMWGELREKTDNVYSDMLREMMSSVDERDLIRKKKETTVKKE